MEKGMLLVALFTLCGGLLFAGANEDLIKAIQDNDKKALLQALKSGADVNKNDISGKLPIVIAVEKSKPKIIKILLQNKATLPKDILKTAIDLERKKVLKVLCKNGANPNTPFDDGNLPLVYAVSKNSEKSVKALLKLGASPTLKNKAGVTAIEEAKKNPNPKILKALSKKQKK